MVERANSVPSAAADAALPPVGPCVDSSNLVLAIFGAIFGTLLLCTAFALLIWYLMRTDKFQLADKFLVLERGLLGRRGGRTEAEGEQQEEGTDGKKRWARGREEEEMTVEVRGNKKMDGMSREGPVTAVGGGGRRGEGRAGGEGGAKWGNGRGRGAEEMSAEEREEEEEHTKGRKEEETKGRSSTAEERTMRGEMDEKGTIMEEQQTEDSGRKGKGATAEEQDERFGNKGETNEQTVANGQKEEEEEAEEVHKVGSRREKKEEKELMKKQRQKTNGRARETTEITNGHRIGQTVFKPPATTVAELNHHNRSAEVVEEQEEEGTAEDDAPGEQQKNHSARLMTLLSADQFGTLEMNRRRLDTERRQLRELGVI